MSYLETIRIIKYNLFPEKYGHFGNYPNWDFALRHCSGYDSEIILEKV
jgi:hypothetical protein